MLHGRSDMTRWAVGNGVSYCALFNYRGILRCPQNKTAVGRAPPIRRKRQAPFAPCRNRTIALSWRADAGKNHMVDPRPPHQVVDHFQTSVNIANPGNIWNAEM